MFVVKRIAFLDCFALLNVVGASFFLFFQNNFVAILNIVFPAAICQLSRYSLFSCRSDFRSVFSGTKIRSMSYKRPFKSAIEVRDFESSVSVLGNERGRSDVDAEYAVSLDLQQIF